MTGNTKVIIGMVIVLIILIGASIYLSQLISTQDQSPQDSSADDTPVNEPFYTPTEVVISNITSSSVTLSWITEEDALGYVAYGLTAENIQTTKRDIRDTTGSIKRKIHYVQITGLEQDKEYYFSIFVNNQAFADYSVKTFRTFKETDQITTPQTVAISAPTDFTNGIIYAHAKKGNSFSSTISTLASSRNIAMTKSNMKDPTTGNAFDLTDAYILFSATNSGGERGRAVVEASESKATIETISFNTIAYAANTNFDIPTQTPTPTPTPTPTTPVTPTPTTPVTTPTNNTTTIPTVTTTTLPKTSISQSQLFTFSLTGFASCLIVLGVLLRKGEFN